MKKIWRIAALLLALAITFPCLVSCSLSPIAATEEELAVVGKVGTRFGQNADRVLADNGYYDFVHRGLLSRDARGVCREPGTRRTCARADATP